MRHARSAHTVVSTGDAIWALAGTGDGGRAVLEIERFDGSQWRVESTLPAGGLNAPAAAAVNGRIYLIGGFETTTNVPTTHVHVYDPATRRWSAAAPLPAPRGGHAAVVHNGRIHVLGGGNDRSTLDLHTVYDPATNRWTERAPLSRSKGSPAAVVFNGRVWSMGGRSGRSDFGDVEIYDDAADRWRAGPPIDPRGTAGAVTFVNAIWLIGGESQARGAVLDEVVRLRGEADDWTLVTRMPTARNYARAARLGDAIYVIGGNETAGNAHSARGSTRVDRLRLD